MNGQQDPFSYYTSLASLDYFFCLARFAKLQSSLCSATTFACACRLTGRGPQALNELTPLVLYEVQQAVKFGFCFSSVFSGNSRARKLAQKKRPNTTGVQNNSGT